MASHFNLLIGLLIGLYPCYSYFILDKNMCPTCGSNNEYFKQLQEKIAKIAENATSGNCSQDSIVLCLSLLNKGIAELNKVNRVVKKSENFQYKGGLGIFDRFEGTPFSFHLQFLDNPRNPGYVTKKSTNLFTYMYYIPIFFVILVVILIVLRLFCYRTTTQPISYTVELDESSTYLQMDMDNW